MEKSPAVYIMTNKRNGTLYVGVTSSIEGRFFQHSHEEFDGFTKRYGLHMLVWYEFHEEMLSAIKREKQIKEWKRAWKLNLIESMNPKWHDLSQQVLTW